MLQDDALWTPEAEEAERVRNEEERQRVHAQWRAAVDKSNAAFEKQRQILDERQRLILAIRQVGTNAAVGYVCLYPWNCIYAHCVCHAYLYMCI